MVNMGSLIIVLVQACWRVKFSACLLQDSTMLGGDVRPRPSMALHLLAQEVVASFQIGHGSVQHMASQQLSDEQGKIVKKIRDALICAIEFEPSLAGGGVSFNQVFGALMRGGMRRQEFGEYKELLSLKSPADVFRYYCSDLVNIRCSQKRSREEDEVIKGNFVRILKANKFGSVGDVLPVRRISATGVSVLLDVNVEGEMKERGVLLREFGSNWEWAFHDHRQPIWSALQGKYSEFQKEHTPSDVPLHGGLSRCVNSGNPYVDLPSESEMLSQVRFVKALSASDFWCVGSLLPVCGISNTGASLKVEVIIKSQLKEKSLLLADRGNSWQWASADIEHANQPGERYVEVLKDGLPSDKFVGRQWKEGQLLRVTSTITSGSNFRAEWEDDHQQKHRYMLLKSQEGVSWRWNYFI